MDRASSCVYFARKTNPLLAPLFCLRFFCAAASMAARFKGQCPTDTSCSGFAARGDGGELRNNNKKPFASLIQATLQMGPWWGFVFLPPPRSTRAKAQHACVLRPPERGHLSAKGDVCFFHRNRACYGVMTGMARQRHRSRAPAQRDRPSSAPTAFSLGLLGFFFTETEQAGLTQASPELPTPPASAGVA